MKKNNSTKIMNQIHNVDELERPLIEKNLDILELVTQKTKQMSTVNGIVIGRLASISESCIPFVEFSMNPTGSPLPARSTVEFKNDHVGRDVALMFEMNDVKKPIIIGLMHVSSPTVEIEKDGAIHEITAKKEIFIRCGKSSILLREDGKIVIKGIDILTRASRNNKIKGGSVQLN